ncbi:MAG TPA: serine/threonine-protein kinase [Bryobacteraceae bacterium]|nr:serine/threonine-protein kinase [Bryobacteraceae bacterium]
MSPERWRQIQELYYAARERGPDVLAEVESELRREIEKLLTQGTSEDKILDRPASDLLTRSTLTDVVVRSEFGHYKIETLIGRGGMGEVFRALDTKLNRPVAIKFLSDRIADPAARRRFQREAQMASSLNHPHILTVYAAGEWEGRQYLITEYIDCGTLADWAKAGKRTWREVVELLVGVADGLGAAHEAKILHRDIKPANILIMKSGYAKLADFGLAKLADAPSPSDATRTLTEHGTKPGVAVGTIAYMSPEQASGQTLDARSDIFSFGVLLYELLAGRKPFAGKTDLELLQTIIHGAVLPLPAEIPAGLRSIVEKALEKDPGERYQSMREMVVDLRRIVRQNREATQALSHWHWAWALLASALLIAGFFGWRVWQGPEHKEALRAVPLTTLRGVERSLHFPRTGTTSHFRGPDQNKTTRISMSNKSAPALHYGSLRTQRMIITPCGHLMTAGLPSCAVSLKQARLNCV